MAFLIFALVFSVLLPYPVLSNHTNITERNAYHINNAAETEILPTAAPSEPRVLPLRFDVVNHLILQEDEFEILDISTNETFFAVRVGGKNHVDFQPATAQDMQSILSLCSGNFSWSRRPALIKLNENTYVPASFAAMPHGYTGFVPEINSIAVPKSYQNEQKSSQIHNGHFCLHFFGSKTDGTQEEDFYHQKAIKKAYHQGQKLLNSI